MRSSPTASSIQVKTRFFIFWQLSYHREKSTHLDTKISVKMYDTHYKLIGSVLIVLCSLVTIIQKSDSIRRLLTYFSNTIYFRLSSNLQVQLPWFFSSYFPTYEYIIHRHLSLGTTLLSKLLEIFSMVCTQIAIVIIITTLMIVASSITTRQSYFLLSIRLRREIIFNARYINAADRTFCESNSFKFLSRHWLTTIEDSA